MIRRHVLRTALLPVVTMLGMDVGLAIGQRGASSRSSSGCRGSAASRSSTSASSRTVDTGNYAPLDLPIIAGAVVVITGVIIAANLVADLLYSWFDPRIDPNGEAIGV